jgi:alkanesulfonate monooxygenase SsuD/methylene tetrahydromethanopterin reductase-like flavin-dependent oxidoreductase (luciferase family)
MTPVQFGFILPQLPLENAQRLSFVQNIHRALDLISGHFNSARIIDHLGFDDIESFTTLTYLSALHPQLKFGHTVLCQSYRNPALVAKMGSTLQLLSGGRFLLGIGAGGHEGEYRAYGYDFPPSQVRVDQLDETLQIIKALWTEKRVTFIGKHYRVFEADCEPKPNPLPPIMVGAFKPKMLRLTAKYADEWNVSSTGITKYRHLVTAFEHACTEVDRHPSTVQRSWGGGCICARTQVEAENLAGDRYSTDPQDDFDFVGTPKQIIAQMRPFIDLGVSSFLLDCGGFPSLTTLELLVNEVLPIINE